MPVSKIANYVARAAAAVMAVPAAMTAYGFLILLIASIRTRSTSGMPALEWRELVTAEALLAAIGLFYLVVNVAILFGSRGFFQFLALAMSLVWVYVGVRILVADDFPADGGLSPLFQFLDYSLRQIVWPVLGDVVPRAQSLDYSLGQIVWPVLGDVVLRARSLIASRYVFMAWPILGGISALALLAQQGELVGLVFKQMRQRALSTTMTIVLVLLGVGLAIAVMIVRRESQALFGQSDFGYEIILGPPKASATQLVFNTVFNIDQSPGNIPYKVYEDMVHSPKYRPYVRWAIPILVGDTYRGRGDRRIVGTSPQMFGYNDDGALIPDNDESHPFQYRDGKTYELDESKDVDKDGKPIQPHMFRPRKFEAVLGSEVAAKDGFHLYDDKLTEDENFKRGAVFQATHGMPAPNEKPDVHKPKWHVVGFLKPTHTASDRVLYVPVISLYAIEEHEIGLLAQKLLQAGYEPYRLPPDKAEDIMRKIGVDPNTLEEGTRKKFHLPPKHPAATPVPAPSPVGELLKDKPEPAATAPAADAEDPDAYTLDANGDIVPELPQAAWEVSAVLIKARSAFQFNLLTYNIRVASTDFIAVNPAGVMRDFFTTFFKPSTYVLLGISLLVTIVAAGSIVVGIYNSVAARMREIAILRALGATRKKILSLICVEAGLIGFFGAALGLVAGHALGAFGSFLTNRMLGQEIHWMRVGWNEDWYANELLYLLTVVVVAVFAGLVPALKAYRTSVATNLSAG